MFNTDFFLFFKKSQAYLEQDFSQRTYHVEGTILFPGVGGSVSENLVAEGHGLLQHLNITRGKQ